MENDKAANAAPKSMECEPCLDGGVPIKKDHQAHLRSENAIKIVIILLRHQK